MGLSVRGVCAQVCVHVYACVCVCVLRVCVSVCLQPEPPVHGCTPSSP